MKALFLLRRKEREKKGGESEGRSGGKNADLSGAEDGRGVEGGPSRGCIAPSLRRALHFA